MGFAAEKDRNYFAAAFHFAWAMKENSDSDLEERYKDSFKTLSAEMQSMLREQTHPMENVSEN